MRRPDAPVRGSSAGRWSLFLIAAIGFGTLFLLAWPSIRTIQQTRESDGRAAEPVAMAQPGSVVAVSPPATPWSTTDRGSSDRSELKSTVPLNVPRIPDGNEDALPRDRNESNPSSRPDGPSGGASAAPATADGGGRGGGSGSHEVEAPLVPPVLLRAAWVPYPEDAKRRKAEGSVEVRIRVEADGVVGSVEIVTSSKDDSLDRAALESARGMKFKPAHQGDNPVAVWFTYKFDFALPAGREPAGNG